MLEDFRGKVLDLGEAEWARLAAILKLYRSPQNERSSQLLALETAVLLARLRPLARRARIPATPSDSRARELLNGIDSRLRAARGRPLSIGELAADLHISEGRLRARFRTAFSGPLGSYLRNLRLHRVIELMRDTRLNLSAIAGEAGFADSAAFARFFRQQTGSTARDFRRRMLDLTNRRRTHPGVSPTSARRLRPP
ncbi:MAG TPA: helix-turn-helix transcriptional regulator [Opitutaceae bacterium]|nr:helix-turn-helix transcriptional regulator [Opitutaceae bacterium]